MGQRLDFRLFTLFVSCMKSILKLFASQSSLSEGCLSCVPLGGEGCLHRDLTITVDTAEMMLIRTASNLCVTLDFSAHSVAAVDCSWATDIF